MKKILIIFGTRPEFIKLYPLYLSLKKEKYVKVLTCCTGQHKDLINDNLNFFKIKFDYDLKVMSYNQSLNKICQKIFKNLDNTLSSVNPDMVIVHGDTLSSMTAAICAYNRKIEVTHIESGLRTNNILSPFPEELSRQVIARIAKYNFAPTMSAKNNLLKENIDQKSIFVVGNTAIDTLLFFRKKTKKIKFSNKTLIDLIKRKNRKILITCHRRENFGKNLENIFQSLRTLSKNFLNDDFIYPLHPNPNLKKLSQKYLSGLENFHVIKPLQYFEFLKLMTISYIIITDSGGIQEEAPSLNIPVMVIRETTERQDALKAKTIILVGTNQKKILSIFHKLMNSVTFYKSISKNKNPYGSGNSSKKITNILRRYLR